MNEGFGVVPAARRRIMAAEMAAVGLDGMLVGSASLTAEEAAELIRVARIAERMHMAKEIADLVNEFPDPADVATNLGRLVSRCMDAVFAEMPTADPRA